MTIRNKKVYVASLWDWGFLDECFGGTRIRVTDVDGLVEHNGFFLLIEAKTPGKDVPVGQAILFDQLIKNDHWAVLIIWGAPSIPERVQFWGRVPFEADADKVKSLVTRWYAYAHAGSAARPGLPLEP